MTPSQVIALAFPEGTDYEFECHEETNHNPIIEQIPNWPPDLFGITAHLLNISGGYHHLTPGGDIILENNSEVVLSTEELEKIKNYATDWQSDATKIPAIAQEWWKIVLSATFPVCKGVGLTNTYIPKWWSAALKLMLLADQTCSMIANMSSAQMSSSNWMKNLLDAANRPDETDDTAGYSVVGEGVFNLCLTASRDMFCVQHKALTPRVGCTIRSLSQNLALMPASGIMQGGWQSTDKSITSPTQSSFRCILIPYPYKIGDGCFKISGDKKHWKWFKLEQNWLPNESQLPDFLNFIDRLIEQARIGETDELEIHALVFPEYALDWATYRAVVEHVKDRHDDIEFIISGSSQNCHGEHGNFVLTTNFQEIQINGRIQKVPYISSRAKHHRWSLNKNQLDEYEIDDAVSTGTDIIIWEKIIIPRRRVHFNVFRENSTLCTLICEDLARAEPCHQYVQAVGPNIVFALLMDGAQFTWRWAARYALGLAEDPGSAVVTFTSRALIERSNVHGSKSGRDESWLVGLSRNADGTHQELECTKSVEALRVNFRASRNTEITLDGRFSNSGWLWKLEDHAKAISLKRDCASDKKLLDQIVKSYTP